MEVVPAKRDFRKLLFRRHERMTDMTDSPDYDPIARSWRETPSFNVAWLKHGEKLTWIQRIGFAMFSFVLFSSGALFGTFAIKDLLSGELLGAIGWFIPTLIVIPASLGLRSVLRFRRRNSSS